MTLAIVADDPAALRKRCEVTTLCTVRGDAPYEERAIIPAGPWTSISDETARDMTSAASHTRDSALVELVQAPPPTGPLSTLAEPMGDPAVLHLGQARAPADALTTTGNHEYGGRIGLHVDNWDRLSYMVKHTGRRRLCLNLGPGTRYLLLADLDIRTICRAVHQDFERRYPHTDDLRQYVTEGHLVLCFRLRLEPGEGYIAPTELIPHDGSSEGQPAPSTAAFWLGHWRRGTLPTLV